jgi:septal ring factor EnvC (AmiA/AmiB activator)
LLATDKSISKLTQEREKIQKQLLDNDVELKNIEHKVTRYHKDRKDAAKFVEHLEAKHTWIKSEKQ